VIDTILTANMHYLFILNLHKICKITLEEVLNPDRDFSNTLQ